MDPLRVLVLALLQGVAELFPISSLGHTVIIPGLLGWGDLLHSPTFLPLVVALHLGTATALLTFFWRDWVRLLSGGVRVLVAGRFTPDVDPQGYGRQLALVVVGTMPAGLVGVLFQKKLEALFSQPILAAAFLCANGAVLLAAERLRSRRQRSRWAGASAGLALGATAWQHEAPSHSAAAVPVQATAWRQGPAPRRSLTASSDAPKGATDWSPEAPPPRPEDPADTTLRDVSFVQAALIGAAQSFALLPGISRSGATMVGGLAVGLPHQAAARFSFLLATPIILAAGVLEVPQLFAAGTQTVILALGGGGVAGIAAYLSVRFLMRYFETRRLTPFAYYCVAAGALTFVYFFLQAFQILP
jgi:undecaprenyl-diphosphatase